MADDAVAGEHAPSPDGVLAGTGRALRPHPGAATEPVVVGISGGTGIVYGIRILQALRAAGVPTHLVFSRGARMTLPHESGLSVRDVLALADVLLIAQALPQTSRIRLGPLGHLLPYHHPVELAHRAAHLDHLSGGRYQFGAAISALPTDRRLFAIDGEPGLNREMTFEALDIIDRLWTRGPQPHTGRFWTHGVPDSPLPGLGYHLRPYQQPHPPIALAGLTAGSANHRLAGARGYLPVSLCVTPDHTQLAQHFTTVAEGAAGSGRTADRATWRIIRDVLIAPTDDEARHLARNSPMARCWQEFLLPLYLHLGLGPLLGALPDGRTVPEDRIDIDHLIDHLWLVGSPPHRPRPDQPAPAGHRRLRHPLAHLLRHRRPAGDLATLREAPHGGGAATAERRRGVLNRGSPAAGPAQFTDEGGAAPLRRQPPAYGMGTQRGQADQLDRTVGQHRTVGQLRARSAAAC
ncbi:LLM class flavin-dependent oxidoreductase [Streptomyces sp. CT34]|uniref:LLM class flavin-dependent oxidoreductase n=1 Tax=Streptomyces sp. CT34 TaxID=1553907 RepID=UPI0006904FA8|nr:LLM class flavin-dependent oxidoreductase [Streptomyces sp. CT34]